MQKSHDSDAYWKRKVSRTDRVYWRCPFCISYYPLALLKVHCREQHDFDWDTKHNWSRNA